MILGEHTYTDGYNTLEETSDGAYGILCRAVDTGEVDMGLLDVIDLEQDLMLLEDDEAAKAAVTLAMCGWKPSQLGGLFDQRLARGRTGRRLLEDAVLMLRRRRMERDAA
jgi:hypothetical protein